MLFGILSHFDNRVNIILCLQLSLNLKHCVANLMKQPGANAWLKLVLRKIETNFDLALRQCVRQKTLLFHVSQKSTLSEFRLTEF